MSALIRQGNTIFDGDRPVAHFIHGWWYTLHERNKEYEPLDPDQNREMNAVKEAFAEEGMEV